MARAIGLMVLFAFAAAVPGAHIGAMLTEDGEAVTLVEQEFGIPAFTQVAKLSAEESFIYESAVFSPENRPPEA